MFSKKLLLFGLLSCMSIAAGSWRVLVYMDSTDDLSDMAIKNLTDMMRVKLADGVSFCIQLHAHDRISYRYILTPHGLTLHGQAALSGNSKHDFIQAVSWAFSDHQSDHTMLIFWNHGWGILDPVWNEHIQEWQLSVASPEKSCPAKRGFMFSKEPRTYLTNQDLIDGLTYAKGEIFGGGKIDIVAFDTCMGGMIEIAYELAPYAHFLVGNQTCSLRDGFDYAGILNGINMLPTPRALVKEMVQVFDSYYKKNDESGTYAHTALDLAKATRVAEALDVLIVTSFRSPVLSSMVRHAYGQAPRFCMFPMYTDAVAFIKLIEKQLDKSPAHISLKQMMYDFYEVSQQFVVARCAGKAVAQKTYGFGIYLPADAIDSSYRKTVFSRKGRWIKLLEYLEKYGQLPID